MANKNTTKHLSELLEIMATLRDPKLGCFWDQAQTFDSIIPYTIEETYEVVDAIERQDWPELQGELGDLLLQILFYTQMASEQNLFDFSDIELTLKQKLIRRHPHVFGEKDQHGEPLVAADWEGIKAQERNQKQTVEQQPASILADIPASLPSLTRAMKIQKRCAAVGFDWQSLAPVVAKVHEEIDEVMEEALAVDSNQARIEEEIGDLLFAVTNLARHLDCDPETALRKANNKFIGRFSSVEQQATQNGKRLTEYNLDELECFWQQAKKSK